ncbi:MAG: TraB/GumN family protein [Candidatus Methanomethylophilaceae archaeon]|nr:TraB/GumN family protein [Candidatus Methanomethylophilaceae archaeon]
MITIIGTIHVVDIAEPIMFIIKHIWPQAVLVELDMTRYNAMNGIGEEKKKDDFWMVKHTAEYQENLAKENRSAVGNEMLTAVQTGRLVGAEIGFIDDNASQMIKRAWEAMTFVERMRYRFSMIRDRFKRQKDVQRIIDDSEYSDQAIESFRKSYPNMARILIDERNISMAGQIEKYCDKYDEIVVVVGDAHVEGLCTLLEGKDIRKIRLADILHKERLDAVRASIWNNRGEEDEGQVDSIHTER